jgi:hypothetical protein
MGVAPKSFIVVIAIALALPGPSQRESIDPER